jgi:hypothetical protein
MLFGRAPAVGPSRASSWFSARDMSSDIEPTQCAMIWTSPARATSSTFVTAAG